MTQPINPTPHHNGLEQLVQLAQAQPALPHTPPFYFLRHGQTARNAARVFQDRNEPLDTVGQQQASTAAHRLVQEPIRSIVGSDVVRASQTAHTVARQLALPWTVHTGLRERHFGALIGTSSVNLDWACVPAGGETLEAFVQRTCTGVAEALAAAANNAPVLLVAHGGVKRVPTLISRKVRSTSALPANTVEPALPGDWCCPLQGGWRERSGAWGCTKIHHNFT